MKKRYLLFLLIPVMLLGSGCVQQRSTPSTIDYSYKKERIFSYPLDTVWQAIIETLTEEEEPITTIEKESRIIVTDFVLFYEGYFPERVLPKKSLETIRKGRYKLNIVVREEKEGVLVTIRAHIEKYSKAFLEDFPTWKPVKSHGLIEKKFLDAIEKRLVSRS